VKKVISKLTFTLSFLALGTFVSSCTCGPFGTPSAPSYDKGEQSGGYAKDDMLYRPNNGSWYGHWSEDRAHAEDHLRAYNAQTGSSGGVIERN
jgi:hypothetical protein